MNINRSIIVLFFLLFFQELPLAQVKDSTVWIWKDVHRGKRYDSNQITAYVNGYETSIEILSLFKPEEIEMETEHQPDQSMEFLTNLITVKDTNHLVIKYFKEKAYLQYLGRIYQHNDIPEMDMNIIEGLKYYKMDNGKNTDCVLEVLTYGEEYISNDKRIFKSKPKTIKYYDIDGKIVDVDDLISFGLQPGEFTSTIISGKEAVEKYGDDKYAEGVVIVIRNK